MRVNKKTKRLTVSAMMAALATAILYLGSFIEVLDISVAVLASLFSAVILIEYGKGAPWSVYGITSILSLLILPNKLPALMYAIFFGYYPIIKANVERIRSRLISWAIKLCIFIAATVLLLFSLKLFTAELEVPYGNLYIIAFVALTAVTLVLYDIALTRVISYYVFRLRHRFKKIF